MYDDSLQQFTGKERDAETGLDYFGARYFSGAQGRFTSVDPAMESAFLEDPQTWNRYSYVYNRPLMLVDPDGRAPQLVTVPGGAALGFGLGFAGYAVAQRLSGGEFRLRDAVAAGVGGAVSGALAGATFGTSLVASPAGTVLVGAGANAAGGVVARAVDSDGAGTDPFAGEEVFADAYTGGASTLVGVTVGGAYRMFNGVKRRPSMGPRHHRKMERQYRQDVQTRDDRATNRDAFAGSLVSNFFSQLFFATVGREVKPELKRLKEDVKSRIIYDRDELK